MSTVYLAHSLVVYSVEKSHVSGVVYFAHSLVVYRVEKSHVSEICDFSTLYTTRE
jgi:hypothetical protein